MPHDIMLDHNHPPYIHVHRHPLQRPVARLRTRTEVDLLLWLLKWENQSLRIKRSLRLLEQSPNKVEIISRLQNDGVRIRWVPERRYYEFKKNTWSVPRYTQRVGEIFAVLGLFLENIYDPLALEDKLRRILQRTPPRTSLETEFFNRG